MPSEPDAYARAGVDIDAATRALSLIKEHVRSTFGPQVLGDVGQFGGLFALSGYRQPVLVTSADGVGTKLKLATLLGRPDSVGLDLVNHCVNDILTLGAQPLFFLDYFASAKLIPEQLEAVVRGLADACRQAGCALLGGETAEMPGIYLEGEYDLVGFVVGVVEKDQIRDGSQIAPGDVILGLPSSGLHTNGYSLARTVFRVGAGEPPEEGRARLNTVYPELGRTLGEDLLEPHRAYWPRLRPVLPYLKGLAHITGGGLMDNVPRPLPSGLAARFQKSSWPKLPIFDLIQQQGAVPEAEMYRVFNMGLGMVLFAAPQVVPQVQAVVPEALVVGQVIVQEGEARVILA